MISRPEGGFSIKRKRIVAATLAAALTLAGTVQMAGASIVSPTTLFPSSPVLAFSTTSDRANLMDLSSATLSGNAYIVLLPNTSNISSVTFRLDDPTRLRPATRVEIDRPYDFAGGTEAVANPFDTRRLTNGSHNILAEVRYSTGSVKHVYASFGVRNAITSTPPPVVKPLPTTTTPPVVKPVPRSTQNTSWIDLDDDWQTAR